MQEPTWELSHNAICFAKLIWDFLNCSVKRYCTKKCHEMRTTFEARCSYFTTAYRTKLIELNENNINFNFISYYNVALVVSSWVHCEKRDFVSYRAGETFFCLTSLYNSNQRPFERKCSILLQQNHFPLRFQISATIWIDFKLI